ncbi:F-box/LRR-repeat protein 13 [Forsythia ovata]|uniref:F-box/LRR-repeat protein 13 n=1 Tax=Forsythia ovata TaxID=205694 RepID=A0ABD1SU52_9LAMI
MAGDFHTSRKQYVQASSSNLHPVTESADRLSRLPLEIQRHILTFLPTIDATRTSVLSRSWRTTCHSLPKLVFDYNAFPVMESRQDAFVNFINQMLARHDESDVHVFEFCLSPSHQYHVPIKNDWIVFAILHNVQKLVLYGSINELQKLPDCLFVCKSLVKLELALVNEILVWPENFELPNLRKLSLKFLKLSEQGLRQDLFSSLPALEKLSIFFCNVNSFKVLSVSAARLKTFIMCNCPGMDGCSISIQASYLTNFIYAGGVRRCYDFNIPPHTSKFVANAEVPYVMNIRSIEEFSQSVIKITRELFKATHLVFNHRLVQALSMARDLPRRFASNVFYNMEFLKINLRPIKHYIETAMVVICRCPNLAVLRLTIVRSEGQIHEKPDLELNLVNADADADGPFHSLIYIAIENFGGNESEMELVKYLLANAHTLFRMRIAMDMSMIKNELQLKISKILEFERASRIAQVTFD